MENIWRQFQNDWKLQEMPAEMTWHSRLGTRHCYPRNGCTQASYVKFLLISESRSGKDGSIVNITLKKIIAQLFPPRMWLKMRRVKVCFKFLLSFHILDHSIYVSNLPSGTTKANTLTLQWAKDNPLGYNHCCFSGGYPRTLIGGLLHYFFRQYKFPEIHKNHQAEADKCSRTSDVLYLWQLQVLNKCDNCKKIIHRLTIQAERD